MINTLLVKNIGMYGIGFIRGPLESLHTKYKLLPDVEFAGKSDPPGDSINVPFSPSVLAIAFLYKNE